MKNLNNVKTMMYHHKIIVIVAVISVFSCIGTNICMLFMKIPEKQLKYDSSNTKIIDKRKVTLEEELINTRKQVIHNTVPVKGDYKPIIKTSLDSSSL
jgi:uncharacterized protein YlxW (UPF0749 family)